MNECNYASDGVPIKVNRVFDSCSDRDCLSGIPVHLDCGELPCSVNIVKARCVKVEDICISIEPVPFNKGFFSIDLTYRFRVELLAYDKACDTPALLTGTACASKSCILYGSESSTKTFFSDGSHSGADSCCCETVNLPMASVSVVEPIALETKICMICKNDDCCEEKGCHRQRAVVMTLGLFSVVELTRPVTVMVPTYEYTIPKKECCTDPDSPCDVFEKIKFPEEQFSPVTLGEHDCGCPECNGCGEEC